MHMPRGYMDGNCMLDFKNHVLDYANYYVELGTYVCTHVHTYVCTLQGGKCGMTDPLQLALLVIL